MPSQAVAADAALAAAVVTPVAVIRAALMPAGATVAALTPVVVMPVRTVRGAMAEHMATVVMAAHTVDTGAAFMDVPIMATGSALAMVSDSAIRTMATVTDILTAIRPAITATIAVPDTGTDTATN